VVEPAVDSRAEIAPRATREARRARSDAVFALFLLLAIGLSTGELRGIPPRLAHLLVVSATAVGSGVLLFRRTRLGLRDAAAVGTAALAWTGLVVLSDPSARVLLVLGWAGAVALLLPSDGRGDRWLRGALLAGIPLVLVRVVPGLGLLADQLSGWISAGLGAAWGGARLGASASGLLALVAFVTFLGAGIGGRRRNGLAIGLLAFGAVVHAIVQGVLVGSTARALAADAYFVAGAVLVSFVVCGGSSNRLARGRHGIAAALAVSASILAFVLVLLPGLWMEQTPAPRRVVFYDHALLGSWETPSDRPPGAAFSGAMFGLLPVYLNAYGDACRIVESVDEETLAGEDLAILINPGRSFTGEERRDLLGFVHRGGALLVLGDHTDIGGIKGSLDELLAPTGLALEFDSAVSRSRDWRKALAIAHPFSSEYGALDIPVSIGASVSASPAATTVPLLVGTDAFSDPGDRENVSRSMLGNLRYDRGEAYGGILLAVATTFGRGKIALFGDTSAFQNTSLSVAYGYVDALIRWLTDGSPAWLEPLRLILAVLLVALLVVFLRLTASRALRAALLVGLAGALVGGTALVALRFAPRLPEVGTLGVVELSRGNRLSLNALAAGGVDALTVGLSRAGYVPVVVREASLAGTAGPGDLWISVGATAAVGAKESARILRAIESGVDLLLGVPWPGASASAQLLDALGVRVEKTPLGSTRPSVGGLAEDPQFGSAWSLVVSDGWHPLAEVTLEDVDYCVAAERAIGEGHAIVVGDIGIFTNAALETKEQYFAENVAFLALLLERPAAR